MEGDPPLTGSTGYVSEDPICVGGFVTVEPDVPTGDGGVGEPAHNVEPEEEVHAPYVVSADESGTQN